MEWFLSFICGLGAGVISAWGVGGGTLLLLVMTLFLGVEHQAAQGINLLFFLPTAASALFTHWKNGYLDYPTLKKAIPLAACTALIGVILATSIDVQLLRKPFGFYLLASGISLIWPSKSRYTKDDPRSK